MMRANHNRIETTVSRIEAFCKCGKKRINMANAFHLDVHGHSNWHSINNLTLPTEPGWRTNRRWSLHPIIALLIKHWASQLMKTFLFFWNFCSWPLKNCMGQKTHLHTLDFQMLWSSHQHPDAGTQNDFPATLLLSAPQLLLMWYRWRWSLLPCYYHAITVAPRLGPPFLSPLSFWLLLKRMSAPRSLGLLEVSTSVSPWWHTGATCRVLANLAAWQAACAKRPY